MGSTPDCNGEILPAVFRRPQNARLEGVVQAGHAYVQNV